MKSSKRMLSSKRINQPQQLLSSSKINFALEKGNSSQLTALNTVLMEIEKYLIRLSEINHIINNYLRHEYKKYKNFDPKD